MKKFARTLCITLSIVLCFSCFTLFVACPGGGKDGNKALIFSVQELDNVFNPFFSTSGYDNEILGQTQVGMLTIDSSGDLFCGTTEPTVALDYSQIITFQGQKYNPYGATASSPNLNGAAPETFSPEEYYTTYQFLIKNGIKFSDGVDLTIKDVIFNMYTVLDPMYYGSSTMYSTAIKGLMDYRMQQKNSQAGADAALNRAASSDATKRITTLRGLFGTSENVLRNRQAYPTRESREAINLVKDVEYIRNVFWDEIQSDYKNAAASLEDFDKQFGFEEEWEVFLYNEGIITADFNTDGTLKTYDTDGVGQRKDGSAHVRGDKCIDYGETGSWWHDEESLTTIVFNNYMGIALNNSEYGNYFSNKEGKPVTDIVVDEFEKAAGSSYSSKAEEYDNRIWNSAALTMNLANVLTNWGTATTVRDQFIAEYKQKQYSNTTAGNLVVPRIEGINIIKLTAGDTFQGRFGTHNITEDQYVLQVDIERVDPKAVWNFAFSVAPMHYYSNADNSDDFDSSVDYRSFNYPIYKGVKDESGYLTTGELVTSDKNYKDGTYKDGDPISVGRPFANKDYLDKVLKASNIISVPVGAGPYRASTDNEDLSKEYVRPTFTEFCKDNIVYYIYNPYFYTTSGEGKDKDSSSISNCYVPFMRYKIINSTKLLSSIINGEVYYGDPSARTENFDTVQNEANLTGIEIDNNGYGYIGINAKYVPDLCVRRAIMKVMDTSLVLGYYGNGHANVIYRPMSSVSWASPQNKAYPADANKPEYNSPYYSLDLTGNESETLITSFNPPAGGGSKYTKVGDVYQRTLADGTVHRLKYTFTIAGSTDDHPAFQTLKNAADILNKHGFDITVKTDSQALTKLANGTLTVWAAAWGSASDPDMYQVYHMDSNATSVRNWGYPEILADGSSGATYGDQYKIVEELSEMIDEARTMLDNASRRPIYLKALDKLMDLAVELPTYQRTNYYVYRNDKIDGTSLDPDRSPYGGPLSRLWEVKLVNQTAFSD